MATTLIDTRKSIMDQIHASWNEYRRTEEGMKFMFGELEAITEITTTYHLLKISRRIMRHGLLSNQYWKGMRFMLISLFAYTLVLT